MRRSILLGFRGGCALVLSVGILFTTGFSSNQKVAPAPKDELKKTAERLEEKSGEVEKGKDSGNDTGLELQKWLRKGRLALGKKDFGEARESFEKVLLENESHLESLANLAWLEQREQNWERSEVLLKRGLKQAFEDASLWMSLGISLLEQGKLEAATAAFSQATALDSKNARARRFLAITLGRRGWYDGAEQELRKSLELEPDDAGAHYNLAVMYLQRKTPSVELARRHYFRARDLGLAQDEEVEAKLKGASKP